MTGLLDHRGNPIRKDMLTREVAAPALASVRSPITGYPGNGLDPMGLAQLMRAADHGDPLRYFELAEQIEERDLHYAGVLGTRKRSVSQIDITVDAASDAPEDVAMADMVREWVARDELSDEMFDILDAIGKQISCTEIIWDTSEGQWSPLRLERVDQRYLTFDRRDLSTPMLRGGASGNGPDEYLEAFKFIDCRIKAKSGIPVRSGIARLQAWNWMFKAFTQRDWAIFAQTYGQPVRVGKFHPGASNEDKATLFRAVANIAGDCAAIIPEGMMIEFIESGNVGQGSDLYERRSDWLDRQTSKAVLGQTGTTDQKGGGLGDGGNKVHERVAGDIETADCKAVSAALNRDLIRPWVTLERGPQKKYPRLRIARPKNEDLAGLTSMLKDLVPLGLEVEQSQVRDKFGITEPALGAKLLRAPIAVTNATAGQLAIQARQPIDSAPIAFPAHTIGDKLATDTASEIAKMAEAIEAMLEKAPDLDAFRDMLFAAYSDIDTSKLGALIAPGLIAAAAAGMSDVEAESA
jgi:phage gp29-like protein